MPTHSPVSSPPLRPSLKGESVGAGTRAPVNDAISSKGVVVSVRLSPAEAAAFDGVVSELGFGSRSDCLRSVIWSGVGMVEHSARGQREFDELKNAVAGLGVGVNQLVRAVRSDRMALDGGARDVLFGLSNQMSRLSGYLHSYAQEGRRKQVKLFKGFLKDAQNG